MQLDSSGLIENYGNEAAGVYVQFASFSDPSMNYMYSKLTNEVRMKKSKRSANKLFVLIEEIKCGLYLKIGEAFEEKFEINLIYLRGS